MFKEDEIVCSKCGYHNQFGRSTCKNCGEALFSWAETQAARRKKPLRLRYDWVSVGLGLLFLIAIPLVIKYEVRAFSELSWYLAILAFLILCFYAVTIWVLFPLSYLLVYLLGHETTKGKVEHDKFTNSPDSDEPDYYIVIKFVPDHAQDSRPRLLTCKVAAGWSPEKKEILVSYALRNPNIVLLEGE